MIQPKTMIRFVLAAGLWGMIGTGSGVAAASIGSLDGLLLNEAGQPLSRVIVFLLSTTSESAFPILTRSNEGGQIQLSNLESGNYQLLVKSAEYRSPERRIIEILPGRTTVVTLILQQLLGFEASSFENLGSKALFRTSSGRRLIFRGLPAEPIPAPGREEPSRPFFEEAVFQIYSNAGLGGDSLVFPGDPWGGTSTNFAVVDALGDSQYIFAGQLNSGQDSLWRLKNFFDYQINGHHELKLQMGYGRISFDQPSLAMLQNPLTMGDNADYASAFATTRMLNVGLEESVRLNGALSLTWGLEINQVRGALNDVLFAPSAQVLLTPTPTTRVELLMSSRRNSVGSSLVLPDGEVVNLADAVFFTRIGDQLSMGSTRHYRASVAQSLGARSEIEVGLFDNQLRGGSMPVLALHQEDSAREMLQFDDRQSRSKGYQARFRQELGEFVRAELAYVRGDALGLESGSTTALILDEGAFQSLFGRNGFHLISTQLDAFIPASGTHLTALVRFVPKGEPIITLDSYSDPYDVSNKGVNLFVRQSIPMPAALLSFLGLEFLTPHQIEALLDIRNLTNQELGLLQSATGDIVLMRNPRTVRGGISFKF